MAVQGIGHWVDQDGATSLRILVTGDDRVRITVFRDDHVDVIPGPRADDLDWQVDQYTQETIGVTLAEQGWEVVSTTEPGAVEDTAPGTSPVYLVRQ